MELEDNLNHIIRDEMGNYDECINGKKKKKNWEYST